MDTVTKFTATGLPAGLTCIKVAASKAGDAVPGPEQVFPGDTLFSSGLPLPQFPQWK